MNVLHASTFVSWAMSTMFLLLVFAWPLTLWRIAPSRKGLRASLLAVLVGWAALWFLLAESGLLADVRRRPPLFLLLPVSLVVGLWLLMRSSFAAALVKAPLWWLVGMQSFRLPLELVMHRAAKEGLMPPQMTFGVMRGLLGCNYDIATGVTAVVLGVVLYRSNVPRWLVLAWNVMGTALVLWVVVVAAVSTPMVHLFGTDRAVVNTWILHAPFVELPAVLVGSALLGHALVFRKLLR